jgi:hypothetical protein
MSVSAEQVNEALALALKVVEARGDKPNDPKIWCQLITYALGCPRCRISAARRAAHRAASVAAREWLNHWRGIGGDRVLLGAATTLHSFA